MSETTVAVIAAVTQKAGETGGRKWVKYSVKTEEDGWFSTFDRSVAEDAQAHKGSKAELAWKPSGANGEFKDLLGVRAANGSATSDVIPTEPSEGPDWDLIGLRKTRCLLWAHFLESPLVAQEFALTPDGTNAADRLYRIGRDLVTLAERDVYWRAPAAEDEDIPFGE